MYEYPSNGSFYSTFSLQSNHASSLRDIFEYLTPGVVNVTFSCRKVFKWK